MSENYHNKPSIISILTLDRLSLTGKAVDSILKNSSEDIRMVFLDNNSRDNTLEYLHDVNLGVAKGRNKVFEYILSNYGNNFNWILSLDNDCLVHKGYDEAITRAIKEEGADVVCPKIIQPDGEFLYNVHKGFLVDLQNKKLKIQYTKDESEKIQEKDSRLETDVILGTSAKTPGFFQKVGFYDEGHKVGWEDFSLSLRSLGLTRESFENWILNRNSGQEGWIPLNELINGQTKPLAKIIFEPDCVITHDHPKTEKYREYEAIRKRKQTIKESTDHFESVWGVIPV